MVSPTADQQGHTAAAGPARWPVLERSLRDRRRSLTSWALGIGVYVAMIVAFWPSIRGSSEITKAIENYPAAMKEFFGGAAAFDYTRPGGFLNTQLFSLLLPLLIGAFAIGYGASTLAGEQESGRLDLVLALPLKRSRIVTEKTTALAAGVAALTLLSALVILIVGALVDLHIPVIARRSRRAPAPGWSPSCTDCSRSPSAPPPETAGSRWVSPRRRSPPVTSSNHSADSSTHSSRREHCRRCTTRTERCRSTPAFPCGITCCSRPSAPPSPSLPSGSSIAAMSCRSRIME